MAKRWTDFRNEWLGSTSLSPENSLWAIDALKKSQQNLVDLEKIHEDDIKEGKENPEIKERLRALRKSIKNELTTRENELDDISLNTPNTYKLQISIPTNLNYLMKAWAAAEGRDLSSVALQCLETGLSEIRSKGSIPSAATKRYDLACEKRIALAEVNNIWDQYEELTIKQGIK